MIFGVTTSSSRRYCNAQCREKRSQLLLATYAETNSIWNVLPMEEADICFQRGAELEKLVRYDATYVASTYVVNDLRVIFRIIISFHVSLFFFYSLGVSSLHIILVFASSFSSLSFGNRPERHMPLFSKP